MRRSTGFARRRRLLTAGLLAISLGLIWVVAAAADAPDPVDVGSKASPAIEQARVISITPVSGIAGYPDAVRATVRGGWLWTTHGSACTDDRAGVGYAVDWNDPIQVGNTVKTITFTENGQTVTENVQVGAAAKNDLNPQDNVVHPTPSSGTGIETDIEAPTQFSKWRGGCGGVGTGTANGVNQANLPRGVWGPRRQLFKGSTFGSTTGSVTTLNPAEDGLSHVYRQRSDIKRICVITYDVHAGTVPDKNNGVGFPGKASEVTAGGTSRNGDNGAEQNGGTPLGNACPAISNPSIKVEKLPHNQTVPLGGTASWTIKVTNTGDVTLTNVAVTDNDIGAIGCAFKPGDAGYASSGLASMASGAVVTYTCMHPGVTAAFDNVVTACGTPPVGADVCDDSPGTVDNRTGHTRIEDLSSNQDFVPNDTANIAGAINPSGKITFRLLRGSCTGTELFKKSVDVTGNNISVGSGNADLLSVLLAALPTPPATTDGTYYWEISYSGDTDANGNVINAAFSECNEYFTINNS